MRSHKLALSGPWGGPAGGAEEDAVVAADLVLPVGRHPGVDAIVIGAAPVEMIELELDVELARARVEHAHAFGHHFGADAVSGYHCDAMAGHVVGILRIGTEY